MLNHLTSQQLQKVELLLSTCTDEEIEAYKGYLDPEALLLTIMLYSLSTRPYIAQQFPNGALDLNYIQLVDKNINCHFVDFSFIQRSQQLYKSSAHVGAQFRN